MKMSEPARNTGAGAASLELDETVLRSESMLVDCCPAERTPDAHEADVAYSRGAYVRMVKPVIDLVGGAILLAALLPIAVMVAASVRLTLGPGVIYRQRRIGRHGRSFTIYKFRTMKPDRRRSQVPFVGIDRRVCHKRDDDPRHTPFGRLLRRSRLDELPQLWNVVKGDMSLVGPRPELPQVVNRYERWQHQRHRVRPGVTGMWQVSDQATGLAYEGVHLDIAYLRRLSFVTDCRVLLRTIPVALRRTGR